MTKQYDEIRSAREQEIEELQARLNDAKAQLAKRDEVKDKIIERRVEQLLGVDPLYQWEANRLDSPPPPTGYEPSFRSTEPPLPSRR